MFLKHSLKLVITSTLIAYVPSWTFAKNSNGNGNGNPFDCSHNPQLCTGNSGNGNGNTGPGNQGNDKPVGNAGGNNGNGGGSNNGGNNNGGNNNGGSNNGGNNNGGNNNGGSNNGGSNNGGGNNGGTGGEQGGGNNGGSNNGGSNNGGGNNGGTGGEQGGGNNGGSNNGGSNNGGSNNGGSNNGGGNNGGTGGEQGGGNNNGGGSDNGGNNGGGSDNGGNNGGGSDNGGNNGGGSDNGGNNGGGSDNGGNNGGSDNGNGSGDGKGSDDGKGSNDGKGSDDGKKDDSKNNDNKNDTPAQKEEKKKKELKAKLLPAFYLDFDSGNKIVNTTPHDPRKANNSLVKSDFNASSDTLVYGDYMNGFQVTTYSRLEGGVGANVAFYYENATGLQNSLWATVGLIPYVGRELVSNRFAPTLVAAHAKPSLQIPLSADVINTWTVGDNTTHASKGGIIFFAGPGVGPASLSVAYVANGTYQVYVEKIDADHVLVRLTDIDVNRLSIQAGVTLASVGTTKYKEVAKAFSYLVNFKDPAGARAYSDLVRGNVAAIQKLATQGVGSVQKWDKMTRTQVGRINHFFFGFPIILNTVWTAGKVYELSNTQTLFDDTLTTVQYGVYVKDRRSRLITTHSSMTQAFYGGVVTIQPKNSSATKAYFGQYTWNAEDDSTSHRDIRSDINGLIQKTGLKKELTLNIPTFKDLEYSQVAFKMNLDEDTTLRLINTITKSTEQALAAMTEKKAITYFTDKSDAYGLCPINQDSFDSCMDTQIGSARYAGKQLYKAALTMKAQYAAGHDKEFTTAYADFGKALLSSPFAFQSFLQIAGAGIEMEYIVNSTYFSSYHIKLTTTAAPGTYVKTLVPTYVFAPNFPIDSGAARGGAVVPPGVSPIVSP